MNKYNQSLSENSMDILDGLSKKDFSTFNETDIREEFLTPLLTLLGYNKGGNYEIEREESFNLKNMFLQIGRERIKFPSFFNIVH